MTEALFEIVPQSHRLRARAALAEVFGSAPPTALEPVTGGASGALIYRAQVGGRPYLMRLETEGGVHGNPQRGFTAMGLAAEAGVAPPLRHADAAGGVAIMDFVPSRPLSEHPGGAEGLLRAMGELIARLQATPAFPALDDYPVILERMLNLLRGSGMFAPGLLDPHAEGFERIREAYPWDGARLVSSHNDPNPGNIIFDGERLWLIDWTTAFRNDPMTDLAVVADNFAPTPELADTLLEAWLARAPDAAVRARLTLMRQWTRLFYAGLIFSTFMGRFPPETDLAAPSAEEFARGAAEGRFRPGEPETMRLLGKACLARFLAGLSAPGFDEALVAARAG